MASHTATGEWKNFELRMRHRRVERLLLRARAAAEDGRHDEARACLEEVHRLAPDLPEIDAIGQQLARPTARALPGSVFRGNFWGVSTAIVTIAVVVWSRPPTTLPSADLRALPVAAPLARTAELPMMALVHPSSLAPEPAVREAPIPPVEPLTDDDVFVERVRPKPVELRVDEKALRPETPRAEITRPDEITARDDGPSEIAPLNEVVAVATRGIALPALPPAPPADTSVRHALDGYAAAYTALDAAAAQRVWPTVNRAALARAFDALQSQRVSFGTCRIDITSATARASCEGSATWAPRIGDRSPRTEARRWTFDLARDGAEWRILNARAQNK